MITPMDIHNKTFSRGLRGYSQEEVDAFLEELSGDYERIGRKCEKERTERGRAGCPRSKKFSP